MVGHLSDRIGPSDTDAGSTRVDLLPKGARLVRFE
jgi:hypothetical protein